MAASQIYSLLICGGVMVTAVAAWRGRDRARLGLIVLVSAYYVGVALNNALLLWLGSVSDAEQARVLGRVLRGVLFPALYIWYFTRPDTKAYYRVMEAIRSRKA
jgi:hypothetical protein